LNISVVSKKDADMAKPKAIIHIGFNKCGSTAIQKWLGDAGPELKDHGIYYKRSDPRPDVICSNPQMPILAYTLADQTTSFRPMNAVLGISKGNRAQQDTVAYEYKEAIEAIAACGEYDQFVASSEHLAARDLTDEAIAALADWLSETFSSVRYIAYIRNPAAWLVSSYGHAHRAGRTSETLDEFAKRVKTVPYGQLLRQWSSVVGETAIDVRLFDEKWLMGSGLIEDFKQQLETSGSLKAGDTTMVNTSWRSGPSGKWLRSLLSRKQKQMRARPQLELQEHQSLLHHNAHELDWIRATFFKDDTARFNAWKQPTKRTQD
jgi:hypothetical protein